MQKNLLSVSYQACYFKNVYAILAMNLLAFGYANMKRIN